MTMQEALGLMVTSPVISPTSWNCSCISRYFWLLSACECVDRFVMLTIFTPLTHINSGSDGLISMFAHASMLVLSPDHSHHRREGLVHEVQILGTECHVDAMNIIMRIRTSIPVQTNKHAGCFCKYEWWTGEAQLIMVKSSNDTAALLCKFCDPKLWRWSRIHSGLPARSARRFIPMSWRNLSAISLDVPHFEERFKNLDFVHQTVLTEQLTVWARDYINACIFEQKQQNRWQSHDTKPHPP